MDEEMILQLQDGEDLVLQIGDAESSEELVIELADEHVQPPTYEGEYEVLPRLEFEQELETRNKLMKDDVTVHPIPVVITSNPFNGKTVVIG